MDDTTYITLLWRSKVQISQSADVKGAETLVGPFRVCRALFSLQGEEPTEETQEGWPGWPKETQLSALVGAQSGGRSAVSGALLWGGGDRCDGAPSVSSETPSGGGVCGSECTPSSPRSPRCCMQSAPGASPVSSRGLPLAHTGSHFLKELVSISRQSFGTLVLPGSDLSLPFTRFMLPLHFSAKGLFPRKAYCRCRGLLLENGMIFPFVSIVKFLVMC